MTITGKYSQCREHRCDACLALVDVTNTEYYGMISEFPRDWSRLRVSVWVEGAIAEHTIELCPRCVGSLKWNVVFATVLEHLKHR
jgi:hypothetical protein